MIKMITEDYCNFDIAKLLKEKGFDDEYTNAYYDKTGNLYFIDLLSDFSNHPDNDTDIAASTLYVAMKWLREVYNIFIAINMIPDTIQKPYFFKPYVEGKIYNFPLDYSVEFYTTYEEACEAAIKYCLEKLI